MAKCRLLYQENEELGKMISSGRLAKLEGELALQKNFSEEMKKSQSGTYDTKYRLISAVKTSCSYLICRARRVPPRAWRRRRGHAVNNLLPAATAPPDERAAPFHSKGSRTTQEPRQIGKRRADGRRESWQLVERWTPSSGAQSFARAGDGRQPVIGRLAVKGDAGW